MTYYIVDALSVTFRAGAILKLDKRQADARAHTLKTAKGKGCYEVLSEVSFKRGELIGVKTPVNKHLLQFITAAEFKERQAEGGDADDGEPEGDGENQEDEDYSDAEFKE